jgi:GDPmannose 4,6-dehydratase
MKALILGLGQDAILTSRKLEERNISYRIMSRRSSGVIKKIQTYEINPKSIIYVEEISEINLLRTKEKFDYTHIFNFAANSYVQDSGLSFESFILNNSKILWSIFNISELVPNLWIFHPLSSEILDSINNNQGLDYNLNPRNAYGLSKTLDYHASKIFNNKSRNILHACIIFNHESNLRPKQFFTKKVTNFFQQNKQPKRLEIYNAKSKRDWGSAPEFIDLIIESGKRKLSGISTLGTGQLMSVENYIDYCFDFYNIEYEKYIKNNLISWKSASHFVEEVSRDQYDEERMVCADINKVEKFFNKKPLIHGKTLVHALLNNEI